MPKTIAAVNDNTALLMKVHTSNYSIEGFTKAVDEAELAAIGRELDVPVVADLGSGSLVDLSQYGLPKEPMPQEMISAGVSWSVSLATSCSAARRPELSSANAR